MTWLVLAAAVAVAQDAPVDEGDFRGLLDQARFFIKKKWYDDANKQLEAAVRHEDGRIDPEAWFMLASVRYEIGDLVGAQEAAERAHSYSRNDEQLTQAAGLADYLREQFGIVTITAPYAGLAARLDVELTSILFDPALKEWLERAVARVAGSKVSLPYRMGLPVGSYAVNGESVEVEPGGQVVLELPPGKLGTGGLTAIKLAQAELAAGVGAWFGPDVDHLLPTLHVQGSVSQPIGPTVLGLMLDWSPRAYRTHDGALAGSLNAWSLGARFGFEIEPIAGFIMRPSAGYRYGYVPGIELSCATTDDATSFACSADADRQMVVYAVGRAHVPLVEVALSFLDRSRSSSVGVGVKIVGERAFGRLAASADADLVAQSTVVTYTVADDARTWGAWGFRVLANFDFAF